MFIKFLFAALALYITSQEIFATPPGDSGQNFVSIDNNVVDDDIEDDNDPLEGLNRAIFYFNQVVDGILLKPIAILYRDTVPDSVRKSTTNFISNIFSPVDLINNLLQGEAEDAKHTLYRFFLNSTVGILGLMDVGEAMNIEARRATLNQTLASWNMEKGPYVMLPILGPTCFRGVFATIGELFMNPLTYIVKNRHRRHNHYGQQRNLLYGIYAVDTVNQREALIEPLNDLEKTSLDFYATLRSVRLQKEEQMELEIQTRKQEKLKEPTETDPMYQKQQRELALFDSSIKP